MRSSSCLGNATVPIRKEKFALFRFADSRIAFLDFLVSSSDRLGIFGGRLWFGTVPAPTAPKRLSDASSLSIIANGQREIQFFELQAPASQGTLHVQSVLTSR